VTLRPLREADLPAVVEACQDPAIPRYTLVPSPYGEAEARAWFEGAAPKAAKIVVADATSDALLGATGFRRNFADPALADVGYWLAQWARGRGVMSRAVRLLARWAFESEAVARLQIRTEVENSASQRVAERAGFVREGVLRAHSEIAGARRDMIMWARLATDPEPPVPPPR
jgi:RimJ/RimL family protein N-acetyltransferase